METTGDSAEQRRALEGDGEQRAARNAPHQASALKFGNHRLDALQPAIVDPGKVRAIAGTVSGKGR